VGGLGWREYIFLSPAIPLSLLYKEYNMPKYQVTMNYVEAKKAKFVVEAKDPDELHELLGEVSMDYLEQNAGFYTCDYEPPVIEEYEKVNKDTPVHKGIQEKMKEAKAYFDSI